MDKFINLRFESDKKTLEVGKGKSYRLLNIDGIDSGDYELSITDNVLADGGRVNRRKMKSRSIVVGAEYVGEDKKRERIRITKFFNIHKGGKLTVNNNGVIRSIDYEVEGFKAPIINLYEPLKFLVHLYSPNPYMKDIYEGKEEVAVWRGAFEFPLELVEEGIEMGYREPSLIANIKNNGDVSCGMKIKFKALATVVNPSLFNVNTREFFKINRTLKAGEIITVTTHFQNKRMELNRNGLISNVFNWIELESTFLQLDVGDNLFRYDADEGIDSLEVTIYYTPQYLGV